MKEYKISVIMPAYNARKYIGEAIESIQNQTYENWELVIVNDGSIDDTLDIAKSYAKDDGRIKVISQANSGTAAAARNTALLHVTGDYIQSLDADDTLSNDLLQKCNEKLNEKDYDIVIPILLSVDDDKNIKHEIARVSQFQDQEVDGQRAFVLSLDWSIHGCMCVRNEIMQQVKFNPQLINGDELTTRRLFFASKLVGFCDGKYFYRDNMESTTKSVNNNARMFEHLLTDQNIYRFAVENEMPDEVLSLCAKKWMKSLVAHQAEYNRTKNNYDEEAQKKILDILKKSYEDFTPIDVNRSHGTFSKFYVTSKGSYEKFAKLAGLYNGPRAIYHLLMKNNR